MRKSKVDTGNFFDYPRREQKKIIEQAVKDSSERQARTMEEHTPTHSPTETTVEKWEKEIGENITLTWDSEWDGPKLFDFIRATIASSVQEAKVAERERIGKELWKWFSSHIVPPIAWYKLKPKEFSSMITRITGVVK